MTVGEQGALDQAVADHAGTVAEQRTGGLSVAQGAALSIGAVLGTGVIALPAFGAQIAGPASLLAWVALVLLSVPLATTFAALGSRYPDAGGVSTYVRNAFGRRAATVVGWSFYLAVPVGAPAAGLFAGAYVAAAFGGGSATMLVTTAGLMLVVTLTNAWGVRVSGRVQLVFAALLVTMLVVAAVTALPHADLANLRPFAPHGWWAIAPAAAVLVWGFVGWEAVTSLVGELRRPDRDVPRVTGIAVVVVGVLYLAVAATSLLVLGSATGSTEAPLAELLAVGLGGEVRIVAAVAAVLLTLGTMNAYYAGAAKLGAAMGRDGALPAWFARGSQAGEVPRRSLSVFAGVSGVAFIVVAASGMGTRALVLLTTGSLVLVYVLGTAAALRLLPRGSFARRCAGIGFVAVSILYVTIGPYVGWSLGVAAIGLGYDWWRHRRPA